MRNKAQTRKQERLVKEKPIALRLRQSELNLHGEISNAVGMTVSALARAAYRAGLPLIAPAYFGDAEGDSEAAKPQAKPQPRGRE